MSYTYPISSAAMFEDRFDQIVTLGIPRSDVQSMREAINDMWAGGPGGWVHEWSRLASGYSGNGQDYLASLAYGCAKFPCLADDARRVALGQQLKSYLAAASTFPVKFERRLIEVPFGATSATIPAHLYSTTCQYKQAPVILFNGGVDTWKMDVHGLCVGLAQHTGATVAAFDQPGTGETPVPLTIEADEIVLGLVKETRNLGNGKVAHFATSFGANYSAMTGLLGAVDCSIVIGAPIDAAFAVDALRKLPYGMPDIIGNDMGFDRKPSEAEFVEGLKKFCRRSLLDRASNSPMLVINGADDYFIPQADTRIFEGRANTEVHLIQGTGHCAFSKLPEVMAMVFRWLPQQLEHVGNS